MNFFFRKPQPRVTQHFEVATDAGRWRSSSAATSGRGTTRCGSRRRAGAGAHHAGARLARAKPAPSSIATPAGWRARWPAAEATPIADGAHDPAPRRAASHPPRRRRARHGDASPAAHTGRSCIVSGGREHLRRRVVDFLKREAQARPRSGGRCATPISSASAPRRSGCATPRAAGAPARRAAGLSFSWRLVMAPPFVLDYLAAHEVAHLRELNHSHRFWRLLNAISPDTRAGARMAAARGRRPSRRRR